MLPPQAPPALVSPANHADREAFRRLGGFQSWLLVQQDALPDPSLDAGDRERLLERIDAFWNASPDGVPRRDAFASHLAQAMRDDAWLRVGEGWLSRDNHELVRQVTGIDVAIPPHVHAGTLMVGDTPYPGALVAWSDRQPGDILLFMPHEGWDTFESLDDLLCEMEERLRHQATPLDDAPLPEVNDSDEHFLSMRPLDAQVAVALTEGLVSHFRALQENAWDTYPDAATRIDALHDTLRLFELIDPHAMLETLDASSIEVDSRSSSTPCSPPAAVARHVVRGAGKHLGVASGRIAGHLPRSMAHRVGTTLPGRLPTARKIASLPPSDSLFNERYIAHGATIPEGTPQLDGVFLVGNARYVRQGDHLYGVRFDTALQGWRLQRAGALDPSYAGPPIRRATDGSWQVWHDAGLAGGAPTRRHLSTWEHADQLSAEQRRALQNELSQRLGSYEGLDAYQRLATRQPPGARPASVPPRYRQAWNQAMDAVRRPRDPALPTSTARPLTSDVAGLSANELEHLQLLLNERLGYTEGLRAYHELAYPRPASVPGPSIAVETQAAWNDALATIHAARTQAMVAPLPPPPPVTSTRVRTSDVANLSKPQLDRLRAALRRELGNEGGTALYQAKAYRPSRGLPDPPVSAADQALWERLLADVQLAPYAKRPVVVPELADLARHQLETLRKRLINTLGEERGVAVYEANALRTEVERAPALLSPAETTTWDRLLASARRHPYRPPARLAVAADLADMSADELNQLRVDIKRRVGFYHGEDVYATRIRQRAHGNPAPALSASDAEAWREALRMVRTGRHAPPPATMSAEDVASRLWLVPESEWPEVAYFYAPAQQLEAVSDTVILVPQARLDNMGLNGIPLFTATPTTPSIAIDALAAPWLPMGPPGDLGTRVGAWLRIDLRAAADAIRPSFELYRLGSVHGHAFVLRSTTQSASAGTADRPLWLFGHFSRHPPSP